MTAARVIAGGSASEYNSRKLNSAQLSEVCSFVERTAEEGLTTEEQAQKLVEEARPEDSPKHDLFEWDDRVAADAHRIDQARGYIMSVKITWVDAPEEEVRAFPAIKFKGKSTYTPMKKVLTSKDMTAQLLETAYQELLAWTNRYRTLEKVAEIRGVFKAVRGVKLVGKGKK